MNPPSLYEPAYADRQPLADRMRPISLDQLLGQDSLTGAQAILPQLLAQKHLASMILWGPPGVGKTTLAHIIAKQTGFPFFALNALSAGVKEVREIIDKAKYAGRSCILFIDEIHRFNTAQQDALLAPVEKGVLTLIGATTENPSVEINSALLSRCQVYRLNLLSDEDLLRLVDRAINSDTKLGQKKIILKETKALLSFAGGDARKMLNALEILTDTPDPILEITDEQTSKTLQSKMMLYDQKGDFHYDTISAFIKSIRGSDPNAAVYYLARMVEGGEDISFIARRMIILASEDIGNANPEALTVAVSAFQAANFVGYPEAQITLAHCATYLATSPKSNSAYQAIKQATQLVHKTGNLSIPAALRSRPVEAVNDPPEKNHYMYAHDHPNNFYPMEFMPDKLKGMVLYNPSDNPRERDIRLRLKQLWREKYPY